MNYNLPPKSTLFTIGIFGSVNAGKSSLINVITKQNISLVSSVAGTTTDIKEKAMELFPIGPVLFMDTPGFGDTSILGEQREDIAKSNLFRVNFAIVLLDATKKYYAEEKNLIENLKKNHLPYFLCVNKIDLVKDYQNPFKDEEIIPISIKKNINLDLLIDKISHLKKDEEQYIIKDLLKKDSHILLVIPIDKSAPKHRLILPQQMVIRELVENNFSVSISTEKNLKESLNKFKSKPDLVITDSQVFKEVNSILDDYIPLTSFSILMARYKNTLDSQLEGIKSLKNLVDNDIVVIAEGCTHKRQCDDIGTVKIPRLLTEKTKLQLQFVHFMGSDFDEKIKKAKVIIHCGGCMLSEKDLAHRVSLANKHHIPITNYGMVLAFLNNLLKKSLKPLKIHI